ncbi:MAG: putative inorganic carbon transporter subunit DabA, partial [Tepidisphaeraceae bacterium]
RNVPTDVDAARDALARHVDVPAALATDYCYRLIAPCYGWASYFRRFVWQESPPVAGLPGQLVLLLLWADAFFAGQLNERRVGLSPVPIERPMLRLALQEAVEDDYAHDLLATLRPPHRTEQRPTPQPVTRPDVQAVFCIDVRSEPLRRHLELLSSGVETRGFAGFFGVSLDWHADSAASARCPALLRPGIPAHGESDAPPAPAAITSAPAVFSYVELLGLTYGLRLLRDSLAPQTPRPDDGERHDAFTFDLPARADAAEAILRNMSFGSTFARIVLLCGHASTSANNPHAAALQCGACGGHGGAINARVAAALLNDPLVRDALATRGRPIPTDTHFAPAVHDTTTDVIELLDLDRVPATHASDVAALRSLLDRAGAAVRQERAPSLGLSGLGDAKLDRALRRRAADYSEPRPEWGLARNAAFIAARRERTHRLNLQGRAFLHEYDARLDPDRRVLTLILSAPMVVASWINLQYFASTVDNDVFGSGNKAVHQRVGTIGVVLGNGGDLRTGLARQSVHDADGRWFHDPLRLQVIIEAAPDDIDAVLAEQPGVRALIDHGWVRLFALSPTEPRAWRRTDSGWEPVTTASEDQPVARPHA